jgi:biotin carboxyl carrier protein
VRHLRIRVNGEWHSVEVGDTYQSPVEVVVDGETYQVEIGGPSDAPVVPQRQRPKVEQAGLRGITQGDERVIRCPLPGKVVSVSAAKGQQMEAGDEICLLESMKMEQSVRMARGGLVKNVKIKADQSVNAGTPLIELQ